LIKVILILGATGQAGWELQRSCASLRGLRVLDRASAPLDDARELDRLLRDIRPQALVNAAAYTAVDKAEAEPESVFAVNATAPRIMAGVARELDIPFVHFSSDYVFSGSKPGTYTETDTTDPLSVYGRSKLVGDEAILASGANAVILRTSWVYSARGHNFLKTMLRLGRERESLRVVADQVGAPTSAELLADVAAHVLKQLLEGRALRGVYHCAAAGETSWHGFACHIFEQAALLGAQLKISPRQVQAITTAEYPTPARRPLNSRLDCSKLERTFGLQLPPWQWHVNRTLEELLV
jgi:dTDP-4-dehydrorhamnose reductase